MPAWSGFRWAALGGGLLLMVLGFVSFVHPGGVLTILVIGYGAFALISGLIDIVAYLKLKRHGGVGLKVLLVGGILSALAGLALVIVPEAGRNLASVLLAVWVIAHSCAGLANLGLTRRIAGQQHYWRALVCSAAGLALGLLMLLNPWLSVVSIAFLIGSYLVLLGANALLVGLTWSESWDFG